jgi:DNA polymerase III delta prime subunit
MRSPHAYLIEAEIEEGIAFATAFIEKELGLLPKVDPDLLIFRHDQLSVEEVRRILSLARQAPLGKRGRALVIATARLYHEAQNALLKLFEEPPQGTTLFLVIPEAGQLLPTLKSRVTMVKRDVQRKKDETNIPQVAKDFLRMTPEKRSAYIKKLASATDEEKRREHRDTALAIVNGVEALAYTKGVAEHAALLGDIGLLRTYLHDRSSPVRLILEHLSLVLPRNLV